MVFEKAVSKHFKNNRRVFSAWNLQNNTNIQPGPEKQYSEMVRSIKFLIETVSSGILDWMGSVC